MTSFVFPQKRILYIDDSLDSGELVRFVLSEPAYQVTSVQTMTEGLNLARNNRFNLYLIDTVFVDGTGFEFCQQIRAFDPETPIVFCTADVLEETQRKAIQVGAQAFLTKPIDIDQLAATVAQLTAS